MFKFKSKLKSRHLFQILFILILAKFVLGVVYVYSELKDQAPKEGNFTYSCPPEIGDALFVEKERLLKRTIEIEAKERELKVLEKRIEEQMNALKELSAEVEEKLNKLSAIRDERIKLLAKVYAEMSPSKAAQQLMNMDREMAVKILSQLKSNQVASILSAMPPDKAALLAEALSGAPPREY